MSDLRTTRRKEGEWREEITNERKWRNGEQERAADGARRNRPAACWISFFPLEKIFHFSVPRPSSPSSSSFKKTGMGRQEERGVFPFFVSAPTTCRLRALAVPDAPRRYSSCRLSTDERSRLRSPSSFIPFFLPPRVVDNQVVTDERLTRWCSSPSPSAKDDDRRKSVETWRRMHEWECQREIAGICCFRFETSLGIKLRVESTRGALSFHWLDMIYNCEFYVIDGIFWGILREIFYE